MVHQNQTGFSPEMVKTGKNNFNNYLIEYLECRKMNWCSRDKQKGWTRIGEKEGIELSSERIL